MTTTITREQEAGKLYSQGLQAVSAGGHELNMLAGHLILMIKGTWQFAGPLWPVRELSDGSIRQLDRFIDYLLLPARDGIELPSLHFLKQTLIATPKDGERALSLVRDELAKEHVDFDKRARDDELKLHGARASLLDQGHPTDDTPKPDNVRIGTIAGNSAAYLAARLKRDFPEIAERLASGDFRSVRAAAIEAGIITPPTSLDILRREWRKATAEERATFRAEIENENAQ